MNGARRTRSINSRRRVRRVASNARGRTANSVLGGRGLGASPGPGPAPDASSPDTSWFRLCCATHLELSAWASGTAASAIGSAGTFAEDHPGAELPWPSGALTPAAAAEAARALATACADANPDHPSVARLARARARRHRRRARRGERHAVPGSRGGTRFRSRGWGARGWGARGCNRG